MHGPGEISLEGEADNFERRTLWQEIVCKFVILYSDNIRKVSINLTRGKKVDGFFVLATHRFSLFLSSFLLFIFFYF